MSMSMNACLWDANHLRHLIFLFPTFDIHALFRFAFYFFLNSYGVKWNDPLLSHKISTKAAYGITGVCERQKKNTQKNEMAKITSNVLHSIYCTRWERANERDRIFLFCAREYTLNVCHTHPRAPTYNTTAAFDRISNYMAMNVKACGYRIFGRNMLYIINWIWTRWMRVSYKTISSTKIMTDTETQKKKKKYEEGRDQMKKVKTPCKII